MKKVLAMLTALTTKVSKLQHEVAALKKQTKPPAAAETSEKLTSRRTLARCSTTAAGSSKHSAKLKDGSEDDWLAAWDVKNNVFVSSARTAANVVTRLPARFRHGAL